MSRQEIEVTTSEDISRRLQDLKLMSRQHHDVATWKKSQQERRSRDLNSKMGQTTLKPTAGYIGIRAQMRNPINTQLPREKKASRRRIRKRDLGSLRLNFLFLFFFFFFLFFSFLYFLVSVVFRVAYFPFHLLLFYFLDLGVIVLS